ncbi:MULTISPECIES: glycerophosphodiester phosphodiesterase family protein [unclassified Campylobacter]|uniref:glycerophosphodiester phosphodiesterase family protein n=1 Tax=unclassified Campylobacter TaxID=2593542 RepID=UPI0022E9BAC5|nr:MULTISPECIES: glycerophosphodiester phosphodiesterase family protein [unclassified Campylobacter]MDA3042942.1 glycerophosphodiester phosphodiesterase family protein [Campylobacter sp. JMF_09 ED2]MDA3044223.1 glycerophosphodiester phosphodiesterase family protein [Campylobacter sp. JMF_07 ED4]MDA3063572.1 glycerophosphodiester phosphodiesterase family protein [Campylobacter sp. JMF_11 EL3]MDA3071198.1 glycerophosphodiester phosphodiesterase family protein [Campylobacter sp. VBCF_03 NA9]MDA30
MANIYKILFVCIIIVGGEILLNLNKNSKESDKFLVIAHRGASGYLPEHTLEAKALAFGLGADFLEQDLYLSSDNHLIVAHEFERVSDVHTKYPHKMRDTNQTTPPVEFKELRSVGVEYINHKFAIFDFTLDEIKSLNVTSEFQKEKPDTPRFKDRFPLHKSNFRFHTFEEELEFIRGLEKSTGKKIGIYPEIKMPYFFHKRGKDISLQVLQTLKKYGYKDKNDLIYLQVFDFNELKRIKTELMPKLGMDLPLVFLIDGCVGEFKNYKNKFCTNIDEVLKYTDNFGVGLASLIDFKQKKPTEFAKKLMEKNVKIHAWTLRKDALPKGVNNVNEMLDLLSSIGVSGVFTEFINDAVEYNEKQTKK